jgi:hypothetical protein
MSNNINGDFDVDSIEAFRAAYASRALSPEDQEVDERTGLPTDVVLNTSPWIQHTGLWKANDGSDKNFVPNQILVPGQEEELSEEELDGILDDVMKEMFGDDVSSEGEEDDIMEDEEILNLLQELSEDLEAEIELDQEDEDLEEEVESLLSEILAEEEEEDEELEQVIRDLLGDEDFEDSGSELSPGDDGEEENWDTLDETED